MKTKTKKRSSILAILIIAGVFILVIRWRSIKQNTVAVSVDSSMTYVPQIDSFSISTDVLREMNIERDLETALKRNDMRFIGVRGYSVEVLGVPRFFETYAKTYGVKLIGPPTDVITSGSKSNINTLTRSYAKLYNAALIRAIAAKR